MVRMGIIGTGAIVEKFLNAVREEKRITINGIYSRTREKAVQFAKRHGILKVYSSLADLAASESIDAVYIASPNSLHSWQSILLMQNGKHVFCEKPLASNAYEVGEMIGVARNSGVVLMEAMKGTLSPGFLEARKRIDQIGRVRRYFASYCQYSSRYDRFKDGVVLNAFKPELSNGALMDIGVYTIYPMVVLFGKPNSIVATGTLLSSGVDGQGAVSFVYEGMVATVLYSKIADSFLPTEIQGEDGCLVLDRIDFAREVRLCRRGEGSTVVYEGRDVNEFVFEIREFVDVIESGRTESAINSHRHTLITMEIMDEIRRQIGVVFPADEYR